MNEISPLPGFVCVSHSVTDLLREGLPVIPPLCKGRAKVG
jgi:hypothetical protein